MKLRFEGDYIERILTAVVLHASSHRLRPHLCGIYVRLDVNRVPVFFATDAASMAIWTATKATVDKGKVGDEMFIDARDVQPIVDAIGQSYEATVEFDSKTRHVTVESIGIPLSPASEGACPNYVARMAAMAYPDHVCGYVALDAARLTSCLESIRLAFGGDSEPQPDVNVFATSPKGEEPISPVVLVPVGLPDFAVVLMPIKASAPVARWQVPRFEAAS